MMIKKRLFALIFWLILLESLLSQDTSLGVKALPSEAPSSLFELTVQDSSVELFSQGFWGLEVLSSGTIAGGSGLPVNFNPTPLLFKQQPDLYLLLAINQVWQFEASVSDDLTRSLFSIGYYGRPENIIKVARLANHGIAFPGWPLIEMAEQPGVFGFQGLASWDDILTKAHAMVRWESHETRSRSFFGSTSKDRVGIGIDQWLRGRSFVLPEEGPFQSVLLYSRTSAGWRELELDEYSIQLVTGLILLKTAVPEALKAQFTTTDGRSAELLLFEKNQANPYEAKNLYQSNAGSQVSTLLVLNEATGLAEPDWHIEDLGMNLWRISRPGAIAKSVEFKQPFAQTDAWIYLPATSEPGPVPVPSYPYFASRSLMLVVQNPGSDGIKIETNAIPGSVTVLRNGLPFYDFTYDPSTGAVQLRPSVSPDEEITISYRIFSSDRADGAVAFAFGVEREFTESLELSLALAGRSPIAAIPGIATTTQPFWVGLTSALTQRPLPGNPSGWNAVVQANYFKADAAGYHRLLDLWPLENKNSVFMLAAGSLNPNNLVTAEAGSLTTQWPEPAEALNPDRPPIAIAVNLPADSSETIELTTYGKFRFDTHRQLSFFLRHAQPQTASADSALGFHLGDGSDGLFLEIPIRYLSSDQWCRVVVDLGDLEPIAHLQFVDGTRRLIPDTVITLNGKVRSANLIKLSLRNLPAGELQLSEIHLTTPEDGLYLRFGGFWAGHAAGNIADFANVRLAGHYRLASNGNTDAAVLSSLLASYGFGPLRISGRLEPSARTENTALGIGYSLGYATSSRQFWPALNFQHDYFHNPQSARLASSVELSASLLNSSVSAKFQDSFQATSSQFDWYLGVHVPNALTFSARLNQQQDHGTQPRTDRIRAWLENWQYLVPGNQLSDSSRSMAGELTVGPNRLLQIQGKQENKPAALPVSTAVTRLLWPLRFGIIEVTTEYERNQSLVAASDGNMLFFEDLRLWSEGLVATLPIWQVAPLYEFLSPTAKSVFELVSAPFASLHYQPKLSFAIKRPGGYGYIDMFVPTSGSLSWARNFERKADTINDLSVLQAVFSGSAVNILTRQSSLGLVRAYELDEYQWKIQGGFGWLDFERLLPHIGVDYRLFWHDSNNGGLGFTFKSNWNKKIADREWQHAAAVSLNSGLDQGWFGNLVNLVLQKNTGIAPGDRRDETETQKSESLVSDWLAGLAEIPARLRSVWQFELSLASLSIQQPTVLQLRESYETRYTIAGRLAASFTARLGQMLQFYPEFTRFGLSYELGLSLRILF